MRLESDFFHLDFVLQHIRDLFDHQSDVLTDIVFYKTVLGSTQNHVVMNVVNHIVYGLCSWEDLEAALFNSTEDLVQFCGYLFRNGILLAEVSQHHVECDEILPHGFHLTNERGERVPKLVWDGSIDQREEWLLCLLLVVENLVRHVNQLHQHLGQIEFRLLVKDFIHFKHNESIGALWGIFVIDLKDLVVQLLSVLTRH